MESKTNILLILLIICFFSNCIKSNKQTNNINSISVRTDDALIGKNKEDIIQMYGLPSDSSLIYLSKNTSLLEYQLNLLNKIDINKNTVIKELNWNLNNRKIVIWLIPDSEAKTWKVIDVLFIGNKIQF